MTDRERAFHEFRKRIGTRAGDGKLIVPAFGPEFHDSMVRVMASPPRVACLTERYWAWVRWRAWCNSSEFAVSSWDNDPREPQYALDQTDAALDIWWFKHGRPAEWVEGAPRKFRDHERQRKEVQHFKARISEAAAKVEARGSYKSKTGKLYAVVSPLDGDSAPKPPPAVAGSSNRYLSDKDFLTWWSVAGSSNYQAFLDARSAFNEARRVARSAYREYVAQATPAAGILIDVIALPNAGNRAAPAGKQAATPITPDPLPACLPLSLLRDIFPNEFISDDALTELNGHLETNLRGRYDPAAYVWFVAKRAEGSPIHFALAKSVSGLPRDFIQKTKHDAARRKDLQASQERAGTRDRERIQRIAREFLDDPAATEEDKNLARAALGEEWKGKA
jgi:hypothetical protein